MAFFYGPMAWLIENYWIIVVIALALAATAFFLRKGGYTMKIAAVFWVIYAVYEGWVQYSSPHAAIRVDLLVIWPVLLGIGIFAFVQIIRGAGKNG